MVIDALSYMYQTDVDGRGFAVGALQLPKVYKLDYADITSCLFFHAFCETSNFTPGFNKNNNRLVEKFLQPNMQEGDIIVT